MRKWRVALIASTISLILLMCVSLILHFASIATDVDAATDTYTITVRKNEAVSVYVTGIGVTYDEDSSSTANDIYHCEINTEYTLTAVNEKMLFYSWEITGASGTTTPNEPKYSATATENIIVDTVRVQPTADDYGKYMGNRFVISGADELVALQHIIAWGEDFTKDTVGFVGKDDVEYSIVDCYTLFLKDTKVKLNATDTEKVAFNTLSIDNKVKYIKDNDIYERMRTGYFLVETSFSLFDMGFNGIGSYNVKGEEFNNSRNTKRYFDGVMCGENNGENSQIVLVISAQKHTEKRYYGLFGYLGSNAVVRNLKVRTSIGISQPDNSTTQSKGIYAGAVAGYAEDALLVDVDVTAEVEVNVTQAFEVCAGAIIGYANGFNVDDISNINNVGICKIIVNTTGYTSNTSSGNGYVGYLAGYGVNTYVKKLDVDNTDMTLDVKNHENGQDNNVNVGGLIGYYHNDSESCFENIHYQGTSNFRIEAALQRGTCSAGGLVGHLDSDAKLVVGDVSIKNTSERQSYISSDTYDWTSLTNCYSGGLFARIDGTTVVANEEFKDRIVERVVDDITLIEYKPIFSGNITIESIQNGNSTNTSGDTVSGGVVGSGYFNINGTADKRTELILLTEGNLTISSTQTILAKHTNATSGTVYLRHCMAGGVYGIIANTGTDNYNTLENINVYAENIDLSVNREIGSNTMGNMYVGGFMAYADRFNISNINLRFNYGSIESNSLSYKITCTTDDSNNSHCGGFIGRFSNNTTSNKTNYLIKNCVLEGFNLDNPNSTVGTNIKITSIQNSKAPGNVNYKAENYVGGIVGQIYRTNADGLIYRGSENDIDIIRMAGHENPDSSFCGGVIGFIKNNETWPSGAIQIQNCKLYNAYVLGEGTNTLTSTSNPDMYIGGIIGANYKHSNGKNINTNINNCSVENSVIEGIANEQLEVYIGGVMGGVCWEGSGVTNINNCYIYDSDISAKANNTKTTYTKTKAYAAGILGYISNLTVNFNSCAVMDCNIIAECNYNNNSYAAGVLGQASGTDTLEYCYSNATLEAYHTGPISNTGGTVTATNAFYHNGNASNVENGTLRGNGVNFGDKQVNTSNHTLGFDTNALRNFRNSNRLRLELVYGNNNFTVDSNGIQIDYETTTNNKTDIVEVWINTLGTNKTITDPVDSEEGRKSGWFLMGYINIYNNSNGTPENDNMTDVTVHFERGSEEFKKQDDGTFKNVNYPNNVVDRIGYEYTYTTSSKRHDIIANIYDDIPVLKINFKSSTLKYIEEFAEQGTNGQFTKLDTSSRQVENYGRYTIVNNSADSSYELKFYPNVNLDEEVTLRLRFRIGYTSNYDTQVFYIKLVPNRFVLVGATFAEYTPPVNHYEKDNPDYGTTSLRWQLPEQTIIKIIPVFKKSNDLEDVKYIDEKYIEKVQYSTNSGSVLSSGELTTPNRNNNGTVTLTLKDDTAQITRVYFTTGEDFTVTHSTSGADVEMIPYATRDSDFEFIINVHYGYSGIAKNLNIKIGDTTYNLVVNGQIQTVDNINFQLLNPENKWVNGIPTDDTTEFRILIDESLVTGNISMTAEFEHIYEIVFDLDCGIFNPNCTTMRKTFKIRHNTLFAEYFDPNEDIYKSIMDWVNDNTLYGYHFAKFYLVDEANSIPSYGECFENILDNETYRVTTSLRFYARWNFLIELVEAPGTHIKTSFADSFMEDLGSEDALIQDGRVVSVPINHRKGFVFTVLKDDNFLGEADVKAYIAHKDGEKVITNEITMEKYYEDMYLYFVAPESITGYLIIVSSISNYGFIPGYNTATVTEEIIPEDGIYTFKYVVNHKNTLNEKSYIYDSGDDTNPTSNLSLNKEFVVRFFKEVYTIENNVGSVSTAPRALDIGTVVEVYYQKYVNGVLTSEIVGTTTIKESNKTEVSVYELDTIDYSSKAFVEETFAEALGSSANVSEKYYVSITPPNGLSTDTIKNQRFNYIIEGGYIERNDDGTFKEYIKGIRSDLDFDNKPLDDELKNKEDLYPILKETSLQNAIYTVTPSRKTNLTENNNGSYTFTDIKTYDIFTLDTVNAHVYGSRLSLTDSSKDTDTIITSRELAFPIAELTLRLGYGIGDVNVIFSEDNVFGNEDDRIKTVVVKDLQYSDYTVTVDNPTKYKYFRIDNVSLNEIRLDKLTILSASNAMKYEISEFKLASDKSITLTNTLENDIRHDGKTFMLAVQIKQGSTIVDNIIPKMITLTANGKTSDPIYPIVDSYGRVTAYFNLSELLEEGKTTVDFNINVSSGYTISSVALLEAENALKPAMAEVRYIYTN